MSAGTETLGVPPPAVDNFTIHFELAGKTNDPSIIQSRARIFLNLIVKDRHWPKEYRKVVWEDRAIGWGYVTAGKYASRESVRKASAVLARFGVMRLDGKGPPRYGIGGYPVGVKPLIDIIVEPTAAELIEWDLMLLTKSVVGCCVSFRSPWVLPDIEGVEDFGGSEGLGNNRWYAYVESGGPGTGRWARLEVVRAEGVDFIMVKPKPLVSSKPTVYPPLEQPLWENKKSNDTDY